MSIPLRQKPIQNESAPRRVLSTIQESLETLRNSEKKVAQHIIENPQRVIYQSITDLAENAGTSEPTIIRFCRAIGLTGYQDLKIQLAQDIVPDVRNIHEDVEQGDSTPVLIQKIFNANVNALSNTLNILDPVKVEEAINVIANSNRIEFFGLAGPGVVAIDAFIKFFRPGISCAYFTDPLMQSMSAAMLGPGSVLLSISHSGSIKDHMNILKVAKAAGATTIAIVSFHRSPLTDIADIPLYVHSRETSYKPEPMSSQIAQLSVIDVLAVGVALKRSEEFVTNLRKTRKAIVDKYL